ncbi:MAG: hypothetical protein ACLSCV_04605 [Acutalibacteraceae bacterium]
MDLIVGLAGDSVESFRNTLDGVVALHPESITVYAGIKTLLQHQ